MMPADTKYLKACEPLVLDLLAQLAAGPAMLSRLAMLTRVSRGRLLRHLSALREAGLVELRDEGCQATYVLTDLAFASMRALPDRDIDGATEKRTWPPLILARTCHDHVAGRIGVALFERLVARSAIRDPGPPRPKGAGPKTTVVLGSDAEAVFGDFGLDLDAVRQRKARPAFACRDWTERRAHLGGALGAAMFEALTIRGWLRRRPGSRALELTPAGRTRLGRWLDTEPWR